MPYLLLAAAVFAISPLVAAQGAPSQELQSEECQTTCQVFGTAPPPCECPPVTIRSGQSTAPQAVRARMREAYARRVETVDNYTALVTTSMTPIPVVQYFEKEIVGGEPVFRQVSPAEIVEREAEAGGGPTPAQMGAGLQTVLDAVRGRAAQDDVPDLPPAAQGPIADLLGQAANGLQGMFAALQTPTQLDAEEDLIQKIAQLDAFWERATFMGATYPISIPVQLAPGVVRSVSVPVLVYAARNLNDVDLGPGAEAFELLHAALYVGHGDERQPVKLFATIRERATGRTAMFEQANSRYRPTGTLVHPHQTQHAIYDVSDAGDPEEVLLQFIMNSGLPGLFKGLASMEKTILRLYINTGPPTSEESATLIREALEVAAEDRAARERGE